MTPAMQDGILWSAIYDEAALQGAINPVEVADKLFTFTSASGVIDVVSASITEDMDILEGLFADIE